MSDFIQRVHIAADAATVRSAIRSAEAARMPGAIYESPDGTLLAVIVRHYAGVVSTEYKLESTDTGTAVSAAPYMTLDQDVIGMGGESPGELARDMICGVREMLGTIRRSIAGLGE